MDSMRATYLVVGRLVGTVVDRSTSTVHRVHNHFFKPGLSFPWMADNHMDILTAPFLAKANMVWVFPVEVSGR